MNAFYVMNGIFDGVARAIDESGRSDIILITHDNGIAQEAKRVVRVADGKIIFGTHPNAKKGRCL